MRYDDVYRYIGELGRYQCCVYAVVFLICMYSVDSIHMVFVGGSMAHWCRVDELVHLPYHQQKSMAIPSDDVDAASDGYSSCRRYADRNYSVYSRDELERWNATVRRFDNETTSSVERCSSWVYDQSVFTSTIVSKVGNFVLYSHERVTVGL